MAQNELAIVPSSKGLTSPRKMTRWGTPTATVDEIAPIIAQLALVYPSRNMTPNEAKILVKIWANELAEFPAETIATACRNYWRDPENKFFPHPGAIIALCSRIPDPGFKRP